ncbi:hypothetical protein [Streptomonospora alba]|uniref:hypothetical protein n=1 Tax=Streptomonospora alba TaxID=183763 RepID=UPI00187DCD00|nr:hypothetical protein [Streptomonospora alba]
MSTSKPPPTRRPWSAWGAPGRAAGRHPGLPDGGDPPDRKSADHRLDPGADLISFGRAFRATPDLVERLRADLPLKEAD